MWSTPFQKKINCISWSLTTQGYTAQLRKTHKSRISWDHAVSLFSPADCDSVVTALHLIKRFSVPIFKSSQVQKIKIDRILYLKKPNANGNGNNRDVSHVYRVIVGVNLDPFRILCSSVRTSTAGCRQHGQRLYRWSPEALALPSIENW